MLAALGLILLGFVLDYTEKNEVPEVSAHYLNEGPGGTRFG